MTFFKLISQKAHSMLILILLALFACSDNKQFKHKNTTPNETSYIPDTLLKIQNNIKHGEQAKYTNVFTTKTLRLLITNNFNTYFIYKGEELGLEYQLIKLYAKDKGWNIQLKHIHDIEHLDDSMQFYGMHMAAASLVIPKNKSDNTYSDPLYNTDLVLVQHVNSANKYITGKKNTHPIDVSLIQNASYVSTIWGDSTIAKSGLKYKYAHEHATEELLIEEVALKKVEATIADRQEAEIMQSLYPEIDVSITLKKKVPIGFIINSNDTLLQKDFNAWLKEKRKSSDFQWTIFKYRKWPEKIKNNIAYALPSLVEGKLSLFDDLVKKHAEEIDWDWKLLSALIYQESRFDPSKISGSGACGLMQVMPSVGQAYASLTTPELFVPPKNITAGTQYLHWIKNNFYQDKNIPESERIKFILITQVLDMLQMLEHWR